MAPEQNKLIKGSLTREEFDAKFAFHRNQFEINMKNQVALFLSEGYMPNLDVIFISDPELEEYYHGYKHLVDHLEKSFETSTSENLFLFLF